MGVCQSCEEAAPVTTPEDAKVLQQPQRKESAKNLSFSDRAKKLKVVISGSKRAASSPMSPSERTMETLPETPTMFSPSKSDPGIMSPIEQKYSSDSDEPLDGGIDDDIAADRHDSLFSLVSSPQLGSLIIPEEVDPDAPSDEEDAHQRVSGSRRVPRNWENEPGPLNPFGIKESRSLRTYSPSRPGRKSKKSKSLRLRKGRTTNPLSVKHHGPASAPPAGHVPHAHKKSGSVTPHTLAAFNKLKVQIQLAKHQEGRKKRMEKLADRYQDVQGYNKLMEEFQELEKTVASAPSSPTSERKLKRQDSFDLKNSKSWFFDFESIDGSDGSDDDIDNQSHLSLLSEKEMATQRRLFEEKSRLRRSNSEPCLNASFHSLPLSKTGIPLSIETKPAVKTPKMKTKTPEKALPEAAPLKRSNSFRAIKKALSTPRRSIFRKKSQRDDSPEKEPNTPAPREKSPERTSLVVSTPPRTPERTSPVSLPPNFEAKTAEADYLSRMAFTFQSFDYAAEENDYGVKKQHVEHVDPNELTPTRKGGKAIDSDSISVLSEVSRSVMSVDIDNDYQVPRRRRQPSIDYGHLSASLTQNEQLEDDIVGRELPASPEKPVEFIISSAEGLKSDIAILRLPSFGSDVGSEPGTPSWRSTPNLRCKIVQDNAEKCIDYEEKLKASSQPIVKDVSTMSTKEFLRLQASPSEDSEDPLVYLPEVTEGVKLDLGHEECQPDTALLAKSEAAQLKVPSLLEATEEKEEESFDTGSVYLVDDEDRDTSFQECKERESVATDKVIVESSIPLSKESAIIVEEIPRKEEVADKKDSPDRNITSSKVPQRQDAVRADDEMAELVANEVDDLLAKFQGKDAVREDDEMADLVANEVDDLLAKFRCDRVATAENFDESSSLAAAPDALSSSSVYNMPVGEGGSDGITKSYPAMLQYSDVPHDEIIADNNGSVARRQVSALSATEDVWMSLQI